LGLVRLRPEEAPLGHQGPQSVALKRRISLVFYAPLPALAGQAGSWRAWRFGAMPAMVTKDFRRGKADTSAVGE